MYIFDNFFFVRKNVNFGSDQYRYGNNWPPISRSGSAIKNYGSADPDPKEIFTDPQQCCQSIIIYYRLKRLRLQ